MDPFSGLSTLFLLLRVVRFLTGAEEWWKNRHERAVVWRIREAGRAEDRIVYELRNVGPGTATNVRVRAPREVAGDFDELPEWWTIDSHGYVRFCRRRGLTGPQVASFWVTWAKGKAVVPVSV